MLKFFRQNISAKSDEALVQAYQDSGDLEILGVLYERYVDLMYGVCLKFFKDSTKADDAVMNIFEFLVEKVKTQDIRQFRPWLHVVAKNHCLMQLRKKNLTLPFDELSPAAQAEIVQSTDDMHPMDVFDENKEEQVLQECLQKLPPQQKHCVEQFYFQDKSYKEISDLTGQELGFVRSNIQNGRRNLRICMEKRVGVK